MRDIWLYAIGGLLQASAAIAGLSYVPSIDELIERTPQIVKKVQDRDRQNADQLAAVMGEKVTR